MIRLCSRAHDLGRFDIGSPLLKQRLDEIGLDGVQLVSYKLFNGVSYSRGEIDKNAASIGRMLAEGGISVPLAGAYFNPVHSSKEKRSLGVDMFKEHLKNAAVLGAEYIGSETGSFNDDKWTYNPQNRTSGALKSVVETFYELCEFAHECGARVAIEGAAGHVCYNIDVLKSAVDSIGSKDTAVILDLFNLLEFDNASRHIDILKHGLDAFFGRICCFHLKDFVLENGKISQAPPSLGMLDYKSYIREIKAYTKQLGDGDVFPSFVFEGVSNEHIEKCAAFINRLWNEA